MKMRVITSTEAQNQFGKLIEDAKREPVMIQKNGRDQVVVVSADDFARMNNSKNIDPRVATSLTRSIKRWDKLYTSLSK